MKKIISCLFIAALTLFLSSGPAHAVLVNVSADAYYKSDGGSSGTADNMRVLQSPGLGTCYAYLKFNIPALPPGEFISSVTLYLYGMPGGFGTTGTTAYYVPDDSWTEASVGGGSQPAIGSAIGSNATGGGSTTSAWYSWALTLTPAMLSDGILSMSIRETGTNAYHLFRSREYSGGAYTPYLDVQMSTVPLPAAAWLFGAGLAGLIGIRRKMR